MSKMISKKVSNKQDGEGGENIKNYNEVQKIIDIASIMFLWVIGIVCIPIMKKLNPLKYKPYAIYVLAICITITIFAIQYLCR